MDQEDWVEVDEAWWKSPYEDVPWSYRRQFLWSLEGIKYAEHPSPPHYQGTLYNVKERSEAVQDFSAEQELNGELIGVKVVEGAMRRYELDVGIVSPIPSRLNVRPPREPLLFAGEVSEVDLSAVQNRWDDPVRILFGEAFRRSHLDTSYDLDFDQKVWNLDEMASTPSRTSTSPDVVDLTDSELSAESEPPPATPNADRKSYAQVVFIDRPGQSYQERTVIAPSPAKPLNASALSFIPATSVSSDVPSRESSESPYTSPTYEFHFPSLTANPPSARTTTRPLPPNLEKDDQGFYIEIPPPSSATLSNDSTRTATPNKRTSASLLPAFLTDASSTARDRRTSKTRAIVDRLRSTTASTTSDPPRRSKKAELTTSRRPAEDPVIVKDSEADVFVDPMSNIDGWITSIENEVLAAESPSYNDGWIEGNIKARRTGKAKSHKRSGSSISSLAPTTPSSSTSSSTTFSSSASATGLHASSASPPAQPLATPQSYYTFATPYAPTYGTGAYSGATPTQAQAQAYLQMQYQMQLQAHAQWQMQMQANARIQAGMTQGYPMYPSPAPIPPPSVVAPTTGANTHSRTKSVSYTEPKRITVPITGVAGIRHA